MNRNLNTLLIIIGLVAAITGLVFLSDNAKNKELNKGINERKAKSALDSLIYYTGGRHPLINESLKGKVVVLNVWTTAYFMSLEQIPELNKLANDFKSDKVVFIGLNDGDVVEESKQMLEAQINFDYKLSFSEKDLIAVLYSFKLPTEGMGLPLNVVINPEGKIEHYYIGNEAKDLKSIREYLQKEVKGQ